MKKFYESPVQVRFKDCEENSWEGGIAYQDYIICGCCGGIIYLEDIEEAKGEIIEFEWINISAEIVGDDAED